MYVSNVGRPYVRGKPLPPEARQHIVSLYNTGENPAEIARLLNISKSCSYNIIGRYLQEGDIAPRVPGGSLPTKISDDLLEYVEISKLRKPSIFAAEIRDDMLLQGICRLDELPSESAILWAARNKLGMTWKKISQEPREALCPNNIDKTTEYLEEVSTIDPRNLKFFDESSVIKTTGNRLYGSAYRGVPAVEIQSYAFPTVL